MFIGFVTSGLPFHGHSLKVGGLGGSETALLCVAQQLMLRGHKVRVYCNCPSPGNYDGVDYYNIPDFYHHSVSIPFDVLISSRWPQFLSCPSIAGLRVLWNHDILVDRESLMPHLWQTDLLFGLSNFHIENYCEKEPNLREHFWQTSNGVDLEQINRNIRRKVPNKLIYTSRPERGLLYLLRDIMPKLWEKKPELRLHFCSYQLSPEMKVDESVEKLHRQVNFFARQHADRVVDMSSLNKDELYRQISSSQLMLYPSNFPEISFIGALESQACGTPILSTRNYAIKETIGYGGILIEGNPEQDEYIDKFVEETCRVLDDRQLYQQLAEGGPKWIEEKGYTWDKVAESWDKKFTEILETRLKNNKTKVIKELARQNDIRPAELLAKKFGLSDLEAELSAVIVKQPELSSNEIVSTFKRHSLRFQKIVDLFVQLKVACKTLLDYDSGDVCFGFVVSKLNPNIAITVVAKDEETAERLTVYAETSKLENVNIVLEKDISDQKFDVVYVGEQPVYEKNPRSYFDRITSKFCAENGVVAFLSPYGTSRQKYASVPERLWNFDASDFETIFEGSKYGMVYADERTLPNEEPKGCWLIAFRKEKSFSNIDLIAKALRTRPYQDIALCMITKDEENNICAAVKSAFGVIDKIVVADSGSKDRTVEFLKEFGAEVRPIDFEDFSQARNSSKKDVDADWIFWMDADERLINPEHLRQYTSTKVYLAYSVRQQHLMMDLKGSHDLPMRLFRNLDKHQFTGAIHEHPEDVSVAPFDAEIRPAMVIPDVDIAHYGYVNESQRRNKCSSRNIRLLQKDIEENASRGRMLTWVLVIRDYLNMVKWASLQNKLKFSQDSLPHKFVCAAIDTYLHYFAGGRTKYAVIAYPMYQEALALLAFNNLCANGCNSSPIHLEMGMAGAIAGLNFDEGDLKPKRQWFINHQELMAFVSQKGAEMVVKMGLATNGEYESQLNGLIPKELPELPDALKLLEYGVR